VIFLHINRFLTSAQGKGNLVRSPGGLPEQKSFPLRDAKQVCSRLTEEDTFFNHTSNSSMSFSLGPICKQYRAVSARPNHPSAPAPEAAAGTPVCSSRVALSGSPLHGSHPGKRQRGRTSRAAASPGCQPTGRRVLGVPAQGSLRTPAAHTSPVLFRPLSVSLPGPLLRKGLA